MKIIKKILIALLVIIAFLFMTCEPSETKSDLTPYMSDVVYIPQKVYAKGKPKKVKKKTLKGYEKLGKFTLTAYCGCSKCSSGTGKTATGTKPKANHTIAVDPNVIPYGMQVKIGKTIYTAEDRGSAVKGKHIDIYFDSHQEALDFGKQKKTVYKRREAKEVLASLKRCVEVDVLASNNRD